MTNDKQRERLVELIRQGEKAFADKYEGKVMLHIDELYEFIADYLLANGVIVPPCKVGETVFKIVKLYGDRIPIIVEGEVFEIALTHENGEIKKRFYFLEKGGNKIINRYSLWLDFDDFGKTVFLTKEEAEQALNNFQNGNSCEGGETDAD